MNLLNINFRLPYTNYYTYNTGHRTVSDKFAVSLSEPKQDIFVRSEDKISFCGDVNAANENAFRIKFSKSFFKKLLKEGLPCAYTGIPMISREVYDNFKKTQDLQKRSSVAVKRLKPYKKSMFPIEKQVFTILENESKKHPDLKLQELLQLKYPESEKILISKQAATLNQINMIARGLPKNEFMKTRQFINSEFDKIFAPDPLPEERFKRKDFIIELSQLEISNPKIKDKMLKVAEELPQSSDSVHAFIVKYAQPYKIKYVNGEKFKVTRDSEELGLRLIKPSIATDEHIYPHTLFRAEEEARRNGDEAAQNLSSLKVTILTTDYINNKKKDMFIDDLIRISPYDIKTNIQNHIDRLIEIDEKWLNNGNITDSAKLADYIMVLKEEFERRSGIVRIDTSKLDKKLPEIRKKEEQHLEKIKNKKYTHKKTNDFVLFNERNFENRKEQKHSYRFSK